MVEYTASLKNNKIYYFKLEKNKKKRVSEKEYNEFNTKKYNKQKGGFSDFRVENLIGKPYKNDMMGLTNLSGNFNKILGKGKVVGIFDKFYAPEVRYAVYGYHRKNSMDDWKMVNLGINPVMSLSINEAKDYISKICEYQVEKDGKMGLYMNKELGDDFTGFADIEDCKKYKNGKYYVGHEKRKSIVVALSKTDKGWVNQSVVYETA
jgi:hypothetical protein